MTEIEQIKEALNKATKGETWINFDGKEDSLIVYEYNRLTEDTSDIIAECKSVEMSEFIADVPEIISSLITNMESLQQSFDRQVEGHKYTAGRYSDEMQETKRLKTLIESQKEEIERLKKEYSDLEDQAQFWRKESGN